MNNVSGPGAVNSPTSFAPDPNAPPALTPDALLAYCSSRMEAIDTNIQQYFAEQQKKNQASLDAGKLMQIMHEFGSGHAGSFDGDNKKGILVLDPLKAGKGGDPWTVNEEVAQGHVRMANDLLEQWRNTEDPEVKNACAKAFASATGMPISDFANKSVTKKDIVDSAKAGNIHFVDKATWDASIEDVKNIQSDISKGAEMNMIQLQSLISQRQLAVQLTTQLMQKVNEGAKQVCQNI